MKNLVAQSVFDMEVMSHLWETLSLELIVSVCKHIIFGFYLLFDYSILLLKITCLLKQGIKGLRTLK